MDLRIDSITGSFLGMAIGDALGAHVEGMERKAIEREFGVLRDYVDAGEFTGGSYTSCKAGPGVYTDDTQQALALCDTLLSCGRIIPEDLAERWIALSRGSGKDFGVFRGTGRNFRTTLKMLVRGIPWDETGTDTAGNGAAMRIAPVAHYFFDDPGTLAEEVIRASLITHRNPVGISAAMAVACVISIFIREARPGGIDAAEVLLETAGFCEAGEKQLKRDFSEHISPGSEDSLHTFSASVAGLAEMMNLDEGDVEDWIVENASRATGRIVFSPSAGFAPASVLFSIYLALANAESFEETIVAAVNAGGDTDTVGAMAGAMAGALHGYDGIPARWIRGLANRDALMARARALAERKIVNMNPYDLYSLESSLKVFKVANFLRPRKSEPGHGWKRGKRSYGRRREQ